jgi:hypothetical protein
MITAIPKASIQFMCRRFWYVTISVSASTVIILVKESDDPRPDREIDGYYSALLSLYDTCHRDIPKGRQLVILVHDDLGPQIRLSLVHEAVITIPE